MMMESNGSAEPVRTTAASQDLLERKRFVFWRTLLLVALIDIATKEWARHQLVPEHMPRAVVGDLLRFTLVYNPGAAFGLHVGEHSRWVFMAVTTGAIVILSRLYISTRADDGKRALALGLVMGGAIGNLVNRIWSSRGVVDFLDVGIGAHRWPTFNVADIGVSVGAAFLAWALWKEEGPAATGNDTSSTPRGALALSVDEHRIDPIKAPVPVTSRLTCPDCGHATTAAMPADACVFFFECPSCRKLLRPLAGDCCVFCSYGDHKCPPSAVSPLTALDSRKRTE